MDPKNNVFKRLGGMFLHHKETLKEISDNPTSWKYIFLLLVGLLTIFFVYLVQVPSALNSLLIIASGLPLYIITLISMLVMVILSLIYFIILYIICIIGVRLRRSREEHRNKKILFNLYIYSLAPWLILATQIPFILIFGGHYMLFNLSFFFYFLLGLVIGWHVVLLYRGIQTNSDLSPRRAKLIAGIYIGSISAMAGFVIYAILYINFSITWLGGLA